MRICMYGASSCVIDRSFVKKTEELASALAEKGHSLVFGCGANGLMGAAARGFHKHNSEIIGVVPSFFNVDGILFEHCTEVRFTETMRERKQLMEDLSDAFIATPGGVGTFEEFFEILTLKQLGRHTKPVIVFNADGYFDEMLAMLNAAAEKKFMRKESLELYFVSESADEIAEYLESYAPAEIRPEDMKQIYTKG